MVNTRSALYHIHEMILALFFFHRRVFVCFEYIRNGPVVGECVNCFSWKFMWMCSTLICKFPVWILVAD